jgi:multidrug resistance efflux pump
MVPSSEDDPEAGSAADRVVGLAEELAEELTEELTEELAEELAEELTEELAEELAEEPDPEMAIGALVDLETGPKTAAEAADSVAEVPEGETVPDSDLPELEDADITMPGSAPDSGARDVPVPETPVPGTPVLEGRKKRRLWWKVLFAFSCGSLIVMAVLLLPVGDRLFDKLRVIQWPIIGRPTSATMVPVPAPRMVGQSETVAGTASSAAALAEHLDNIDDLSPEARDELLRIDLRTLDFTTLGPPVVQAFGIVRASQVVNVALQLPFRVQSLLVRPGQTVRRGQALIRMDLTQYREQLEQFRLTLRSAELRLESLRRSLTRSDQIVQREVEGLKKAIALAEQEAVVLQRSVERQRQNLSSGADADLKRLDNDIERIGHELERARQELAQARVLFAAGGLSQQRLKERESALQVVELQVQNLLIGRDNQSDIKAQQVRDSELLVQQRLANVDNLRRQLLQKVSPEVTEVEIQDLAVRGLRLELDNLNARLDRVFISGDQIVSHLNRAVVSDIAVKEDDMIGAGVRILTLVDTGQLIVEANIPEEFYRDIGVGYPARFIPLSDRSREFRGRVMQISGIAEVRNNETVVPVSFSIEDVDQLLLPHFNVDVQVFAPR